MSSCLVSSMAMCVSFHSNQNPLKLYLSFKQGQDTTPVFKKLSGIGDDSEHEEVDQENLPASVLHRRQALVPPKLITDDYESPNEDTDTHSVSPNRQSPHLLSEPRDKHRRRSSIVVIPPMQICPGDLLVYSQVLNNKNNLFGEFCYDETLTTKCYAIPGLLIIFSKNLDVEHPQDNATLVF